MSNSKLVNYKKISPNRTSPRRNKIKKITIHYMAGDLSVESCGNVFASKSRQASSNYGIDSKGRVGMYVEEKDRAWTSSSPENDHQAITIEVANKKDSSITDKAYDKLIALCVDICKRNGIKKLNYTGDKSGNLTMHCWFAATSCPGKWFKAHFKQIANDVNKKLGASKKKTTTKKKYSGTFPTLPKKGYFAKGDTGVNVKRLQKFLNWYGNYKLAIDGSFGNATLSAVKKYQKKAGLKVDGFFGKASLAKAKTIKK